MFKSLAGGFGFAHFAGLAPKGGKDLREEGEQPEAAASAEAAEAEEEEEGETSGEQADPKKGKKKAKDKAEGDEDEEEASAGEEDGDDEEDDDDGEPEASAPNPKSNAKKPAAKPAKGNDFKRGRKAERRRVGLILSNPAAANNVALAMKLACNTGMSSSAAIALLEATPAARGGRLGQQMKDAKIPDVKAGAPDQLSGSVAIQQSWGDAFKDL